MGPTLGIIGALIMGQAAVDAGIVSPILIIIVAITGITSFAIPDYYLAFHCRVSRFAYIILGFLAGLLGIAVTLLLNIPINIIIKNLVGISNISVLPPVGGVILVIISVVLTVIAGLIPAKMASRKDPVEALRVD